MYMLRLMCLCVRFSRRYKRTLPSSFCALYLYQFGFFLGTARSSAKRERFSDLPAMFIDGKLKKCELAPETEGL